MSKKDKALAEEFNRHKEATMKELRQDYEYLREQIEMHKDSVSPAERASMIVAKAQLLLITHQLMRHLAELKV